MKEFSLIVDKVSQALGTTVDNVVKLYPQLRTEYSWYYVLDNLQEVLGTLILIVGILVVVAFLFMIIECDPDDEEYAKAFKVFKLTLGIEVIFVLLYAIAFAFEGFVCPDILIIERFIK